MSRTTTCATAKIMNGSNLVSSPKRPWNIKHLAMVDFDWRYGWGNLTQKYRRLRPWMHMRQSSLPNVFQETQPSRTDMVATTIGHGSKNGQPGTCLCTASFQRSCLECEKGSFSGCSASCLHQVHVDRTWRASFEGDVAKKLLLLVWFYPPFSSLYVYTYIHAYVGAHSVLTDWGGPASLIYLPRLQNPKQWLETMPKIRKSNKQTNAMGWDWFG